MEIEIGTEPGGGVLEGGALLGEFGDDEGGGSDTVLGGQRPNN